MKLSFSALVGVVIVAVLASAATIKIMVPANSSAAAKSESAYERVMRTGVLRCGYGVWYPYFDKDPNTGAITGFSADATEAVGQALNIKIEWTEETPWGGAEAMKTGRIDAFCSGIWANPDRAKVMDFTIPIAYQTVDAYARPNDLRFDNNIAAINNPDVTISTIDAEMTSFIAKEDFPKAKTASLTALSGSAELLLNVTTGKADVTFIDAVTAGQFLEKNPNSLRRIPNARPIRLFPLAVIVIPPDQDRLRQVLDVTTRFLILNGTMEKIIQKYDPEGSMLMRVAVPYAAKN
ncbi:MAG: substrate-binding periplasmic protein [Dongiaceae bacterium]